MRKNLDKDQAENCERSIANKTLNGALQRKLNQGTNVRLIKNSTEYLLIHLFATSPYLARLLKPRHD